MIVEGDHAFVADFTHEGEVILDVFIVGTDLVIHTDLEEGIELLDSVARRRSTVEDAEHE